MNDVFFFLKDFVYVLAWVGLVIGLVFCFAGRILIKPVLAFVGLAATVILLCILFYMAFYSPTVG